MSDELARILSALDPEEQQMVDLKLQEHTNSEIAQQTGCSERTVRRDSPGPGEAPGRGCVTIPGSARRPVGGSGLVLREAAMTTFATTRLVLRRPVASRIAKALEP